MQRFFLFICVILGLSSCSNATILAHIHGDEPTFLKSVFASAERSLFIRCASISDKSLVDALQKARRRGVVVRILVDEPGRCLPGLLSKESASFLKVAGKAERGKGLDDNESRVFIDSYGLWHGVKRWESAAWIKRSTMINDLRYGADPEGKRQFEALWKRTPRWGELGVQSPHELPTVWTNRRAGLRALPGLHELWRRLL